MLERYLRQLVAFKTITEDTKENKRALDWFCSQVKGLPLYIKEYDSKGFLSLVLGTRNTKTPTLWLSAHMDVVPGPERMFKPVIKGSRLHGRGAYDMKFAIACYLKLLSELGQSLKNYDFGVILTTDEEFGGFDGTGPLVDRGFSSKIVFLPDGGDNWNFELKAKGVLHYLVKSKGKSAHASQTWAGRNAIDNLADFLAVLRKKFPQEPCDIKEHYHPTLNVGKIGGGEATNQVPESAWAMLDVRFPPEMGKEGIEKLLKSAKKGFKDITIKETIFGSSNKISKQNPYVKLFSKVASDRFKIKTGFRVSHGSSDARFFAEKNIPVMLITPKGGGHHSNNEWIDLKDLERFYVVLKEFVEKSAKKR